MTGKWHSFCYGTREKGIEGTLNGTNTAGKANVTFLYKRFLTRRFLVFLDVIVYFKEKLSLFPHLKRMLYLKESIELHEAFFDVKSKQTRSVFENERSTNELKFQTCHT